MEQILALVVLVVVVGGIVMFKKRAKKDHDGESFSDLNQVFSDQAPVDAEDAREEVQQAREEAKQAKPAKQPKDNLDAMTKAELIELAEKKGVKILKSKPKANIISALRSAEK